MIVVPVDGSEHAKNALDFAISMAKKYDETLLLLNIQRQEELNNERMEDVEIIRKEKEHQGLKYIEDAALHIGGVVPFEKKVRFGVPSIEITNEAKEVKAKCIVMGSRGNGPIVSAILGSVSYGVLHLAPCPVTVVPNNKLS